MYIYIYIVYNIYIHNIYYILHIIYFFILHITHYVADIKWLELNVKYICC